MKKDELKTKSKGLVSEFVAFISRGNVMDMAVGVIIGGAFSAIITALINGILMPLITAAIPNGGIDGLVTVLNHSKAYIAEATDTAIIQAATLEGKTIVYYWGHAYDASIISIMNWGVVINAVIYFLAVALILFIVIKVFAYAKAKRLEIAAKIQEEYYVKHPEKRPAPVDPGTPEPTDHELLKEMLEVMKNNKK